MELAKYAGQMLDLIRRLAASKVADTKTAIERQAIHLEAQIDQLVYELYGLTDKEIRIVEEATKR